MQTHLFGARWMQRTGAALSVLVILFLLMDAAIKLLRLPVVLSTMSELGWPVESAAPLGALLLLSTALYAIPRSALLGAILLTAYLGGAVATHARIASPLFTHVLFGVYIALLLWTGLFLRSPALRRAMGFAH